MSRAQHFWSRALACAVLITLMPSLLMSASLPVPDWFERRLYPEIVQAREVQGISDRILGGKLTLTVKSFLELVLRNSTDVNLTRLDVYTANTSILGAKAPYDPVVGLGFNTLRSLSPSISQISGASTLSTLTQNSSVQYQQLLSTGQTVSAGYTASRSSTNSAFNLLNPSLFSTFNFTVFQPLLQGRSSIQVRGPLEIARTQLTITSGTGEAHIADLLATAAVEYWSAVQARDNVKVLQQTLDLAQKSYARDKQALDLGALAQLDIYQSESQVAGRKRDLIQADYTYRANVNLLRRLMGADLTPALRAVEIVLEDDPASLPSKATILPYEEALAAAMRVRPELDAAHRAVTVDEINAKIARNLLLPRLDLSVQVQSVGLGGNQVAIVGPLGITTAGDVGRAWRKSGAAVLREYSQLWRRPATDTTVPQQRCPRATGAGSGQQDTRSVQRTPGAGTDCGGRTQGSEFDRPCGCYGAGGDRRAGSGSEEC